MKRLGVLIHICTNYCSDIANLVAFNVDHEVDFFFGISNSEIKSQTLVIYFSLRLHVIFCVIDYYDYTVSTRVTDTLHNTSRPNRTISATHLATLMDKFHGLKCSFAYVMHKSRCDREKYLQLRIHKEKLLFYEYLRKRDHG